MNKLMNLSSVYESLVKMCDEAGTNITQICRDADVNRSVLERWKKENPKTLETLVKLIDAIEEAKKK